MPAAVLVVVVIVVWAYCFSQPFLFFLFFLVLQFQELFRWHSMLDTDTLLVGPALWGPTVLAIKIYLGIIRQQTVQLAARYIIGYIM